MAVYRQVHVSFWQDAFVLSLTPEEKYFYLYLMTNSKTSQCGIYEISEQVMILETGYNQETITKLLNKFIKYGKIEYNRKNNEIFMVNWLRYNGSTSPKVQKRIEQELKSVKTREFKENYNTLSILYGYSMDTQPQKEKEKEKEKKEKEEKNYNTVSLAPSVEEITKHLNWYYGMNNTLLKNCSLRDLPELAGRYFNARESTDWKRGGNKIAKWKNDVINFVKSFDDNGGLSRNGSKKQTSEFETEYIPPERRGKV
jgi:hypothetical protein